MAAAAFTAVFPQLVNDILEDVKQYNIPTDSKEWLEKMIHYNIMGGKMNRGISVAETYQLLVNPADMKPNDLNRAQVLGWTVEFLQSFFLIADDIMDQSITRRGAPCWYRVPKVGNVAINDSFLVESFLYKLLKKYFREEKYYVDLLELYHEVTYQTELGQLLDLITAPEDEVDLNRFSMDKYKWIVKYKTAYYSFYLPVALAMFMAGYTKDSEAFVIAEKILLDMGEYFQIQDDYLDCFGEPEMIGKIGTDIQDNKCSWLVNKALEIANAEQLETLKQNYGKKDDKCVAAVKNLYKELGLEGIFKQYEEESYTRLTGMIQSYDSKLISPQVFISFMNKIYKRTK